MRRARQDDRAIRLGRGRDDLAESAADRGRRRGRVFGDPVGAECGVDRAVEVEPERDVGRVAAGVVRVGDLDEPTVGLDDRRDGSTLGDREVRLAAGAEAVVDRAIGVEPRDLEGLDEAVEDGPGHQGLAAGQRDHGGRADDVMLGVEGRGDAQRERGVSIPGAEARVERPGLGHQGPAFEGLEPEARPRTACGGLHRRSSSSIPIMRRTGLDRPSRRTYRES